MAFTQEQVLNLADHGPEVVADILGNADIYTAEQVTMARKARRVLIARQELAIDQQMAAYDNA